MIKRRSDLSTLVALIKNKGISSLFSDWFLRSFGFRRLAEFVTKSIENTSNSLTVKEAMKKIGLKECVFLHHLRFHPTSELIYQ